MLNKVNIWSNRMNVIVQRKCNWFDSDSIAIYLYQYHFTYTISLCASYVTLRVLNNLVTDYKNCNFVPDS